MKGRPGPAGRGGVPGAVAGARVREEWPAWRRELYRVIFEHDTPAGRLFDILLIATILTSVAVVMADSVAEVHAEHGRLLWIVEWGFTLLFSLEYVLRLVSAPSARRYALSFFGVVDLVAVLPTYLSLVFPGGQYLLVIRILRLVRIFRVLKLARFMGGERILLRAVQASLHKIAVFLISVLTIVVVVGALMHIVEGPASGFTSIPRSVYWAVVTLTTVGYGDIAPQTAAGQILAGMVMILGYGIIAVPTGIVTVEIAAASRAGFDRASAGAPEGSAEAAVVGEPAVSRACAGCGATRQRHRRSLLQALWRPPVRELGKGGVAGEEAGGDAGGGRRLRR